MRGEKIIKSFVYENEGRFEKKKFFEYTRSICETLDIPTPVILLSHVNNYNEFNIARFKPHDFVESVDFGALVLENASDC